LVSIVTELIVAPAGIAVSNPYPPCVRSSCEFFVVPRVMDATAPSDAWTFVGLVHVPDTAVSVVGKRVTVVTVGDHPEREIRDKTRDNVRVH
jgi:hypothetical protein